MDSDQPSAWAMSEAVALFGKLMGPPYVEQALHEAVARAIDAARAEGERTGAAKARAQGFAAGQRAMRRAAVETASNSRWLQHDLATELATLPISREYFRDPAVPPSPQAPAKEPDRG